MKSFSDDQITSLVILNKASDILQNQWAMSDGPMAGADGFSWTRQLFCSQAMHEYVFVISCSVLSGDGSEVLYTYVLSYRKKQWYIAK